ncbi:MAG: sugar nucleotide-binding protein [Saccharothrix sp.]|nr:sugar nucleotide-binding protein [Saccharothrix sp.]
MLVTGGSGSLGRHVVQRAAAAGWTVVGTYFAEPTDTADQRLDIRDPEAVRRVLRGVRPDVVVHTATGRDRDDWRTTADGAANIAVAAAGVRLVHVSSDSVFSGRAVHYDEDALPDPIYRYGAAKAAAETAVRAVHPDAALVRTSLVLGDGLSAHERLTHALAAGQLRGGLFTDEVRKPVHVHDLADALVELAGGDYRGVLNVVGADAVSRYELGVLVAARDGLDPLTLPATRSASPYRPPDIRLTTARAEALLRTRLRGAREFLRARREPRRGS